MVARRIPAVREADTDGNPTTVADPDWTPLLVTPPFPRYPSGHTCGTGARMPMLALFIGRDDVASARTATTPAPAGTSPVSPRLAEVVDARVWGGVHFRTADLDGARLGAGVAGYATRHHVRPPR